jgi:hypothetical protein
VLPAEEQLLVQIERQIGQPLPDFDYGQAAPKPAGPPPARAKPHPARQQGQAPQGRGGASRGKRRRSLVAATRPQSDTKRASRAGLA